MNALNITINNQPFKHLLFHFRMGFLLPLGAYRYPQVLIGETLKTSQAKEL